MTEKERDYIAPHRHCIICGKSTTIDREICSKKCEEMWFRQQKKQKRSQWIWIGLLVIFFLIFIVLASIKPKG
ncbi:MAG: DUF2116 family Zn-ribbon domain-containing protein [Euryarchaeota archaeon]|nr:DUF2116 family Zn-ribbon domain-containing protein [Euryarchaeota archaeon]